MACLTMAVEFVDCIIFPLPLLRVQLLLFVVNVAPLQEVFEEQDDKQSLTLVAVVVFIALLPLNALLSAVVKPTSSEFIVVIKSLYVL
jgi:hypothetical protein